MAYYFQKCCFDSEKIEVINECGRMLCILNRKHEFQKYYHKGNDETFYCLNRKQLGEYWHCVIEDQKVFCPEECDECKVCKVVIEVFENLQVAYVFTPNKNKHQPILWRAFFKGINNSKKFRLEIAKTVESADLVLNNGSTC